MTPAVAAIPTQTASTSTSRLPLAIRPSSNRQAFRPTLRQIPIKAEKKPIPSAQSSEWTSEEEDGEDEDQENVGIAGRPSAIIEEEEQEDGDCSDARQSPTKTSGREVTDGHDPSIASELQSSLINLAPSPQRRSKASPSAPARRRSRRLSPSTLTSDSQQDVPTSPAAQSQACSASVSQPHSHCESLPASSPSKAADTSIASSDRPASSSGTAFSDMETDAGPSILVDSDTQTECHSDSDGETSAADDDVEARHRSYNQQPAVFFGTPSSDEKEQRRRYSRRVRERRLLRRDSLELARRKTLTLEEVEEAAQKYRQEQAALAEKAAEPVSGASTQLAGGEEQERTESVMENPQETQRDECQTDCAEAASPLEELAAPARDVQAFANCQQGFTESIQESSDAPAQLAENEQSTGLVARYAEQEAESESCIALDMVRGEERIAGEAQDTVVASTSGTLWQDETILMDDVIEEDATVGHISASISPQQDRSEAIHQPSSSAASVENIAGVAESADETLALNILEEAAESENSLPPSVVSNVPMLPADANQVNDVSGSTVPCQETATAEEVESIRPAAGETQNVSVNEIAENSVCLEVLEQAALSQQTPDASMRSTIGSATKACEGSPEASFTFGSPGVGLSHFFRQSDTPSAHRTRGTPGSLARIAGLRALRDEEQALSAMKAKKSPVAHLAPPTPLGERDANRVRSLPDVELSPVGAKPTPSRQSRRLSGLAPDSPHASPATPSKGKNDDLAISSRLFSPEMVKLREARDAMLVQGSTSPEKSPKKASRVMMATPGKSQQRRDGAENESPRLVTTATPRKSPMGAFGSTIKFWQTLREHQAETEDDKTALRQEEASSSPSKGSVSDKQQALASSLLSRLPSPEKSSSPTKQPIDQPKTSQGTQVEKSMPPPSVTAKAVAPTQRTATTSRLPQPPGSRMANVKSSSGIRPPSAICAPKARVADPAKVAGPANGRIGGLSRSSDRSSQRPSSAESASSSSSANLATTRMQAMPLKDVRRPLNSASGVAKMSRPASAPEKKTGVSALRKLQSSQGNAEDPFGSAAQPVAGHIASWLSSSSSGGSARETKGVGQQDRRASSPSKPAVDAPGPSPSRLRVNLSPIKLTRSTGLDGATRARRVPVGSREATHAPERALSKAAATASSSAPAPSRASVAPTVSASKPATHVNLQGTVPVLPRSASLARRAGATRTASNSVTAVDDEVPTSLPEVARERERRPDSVLSQDEGVHPKERPSSASEAAPTGASRSTAPRLATRAPSSLKGPRAGRARSEPVPSVPISSAALASLTTRNSRKNEAYYARLNVVTVRIHTPRPPSPSSKIRKSGMAGTRRLGKEAAAAARADRARKRATGEQEREGSLEPWDMTASSTASLVASGKHRMGAGESEMYSTPLKVQAGNKGVKWHKTLFAGPSASYGSNTADKDHGEEATSAPAHNQIQPSSPCLSYKDYKLDRHGNVRSATEVPASPRWSKVKVTVSKIVYDDDDDDDNEEAGEDAQEAVMAALRDEEGWESRA